MYFGAFFGYSRNVWLLGSEPDLLIEPAIGEDVIIPEVDSGVLAVYCDCALCSSGHVHQGNKNDKREQFFAYNILLLAGLFIASYRAIGKP